MATYQIVSCIVLTADIIPVGTYHTKTATDMLDS